MSIRTPAAPRHSTLEDGLALVIGTVIVSFGLAMYAEAGILTGSTAGLAFLVFYAWDIPFGPVFFVLNIPFYLLSAWRMGWAFTGKTVLAVAMVSALAELHRRFLHLDDLSPFYAAPVAGAMMGVGFLVLFRHRASLGGVNILALFLQDRGVMSAGRFQMIVDLCIMLAALWVVDIQAVAASALGVVAMNLIVAMNHRADRYVVA